MRVRVFSYFMRYGKFYSHLYFFRLYSCFFVKTRMISVIFVVVRYFSIMFGEFREFSNYYFGFHKISRISCLLVSTHFLDQFLSLRVVSQFFGFTRFHVFLHAASS